MPTPTLPTVKEISKEIRCEHEFHMRVRKSMLIAFDLFWNHFDGQLTASGIDNLSSATMADAARGIGQRAPGGPETESLIRSLLHQILKAHDASLTDTASSAIEQAVAAARAHGRPVILVLPDTQ
ncbi:hypothetical protein ACIPJN_29780 [Streptomyces sp. NPDC086796]|uniref:hypothetical protein n=1 Tax=Streptomyces sp. NPDC086796 TaxID=3365760 RepID=UPI003803BC9D